MSDEQQYLDLIQKILDDGTERVGRGGATTKSIFGHTSRYSLSNDTVPLLTTKKMFTRGIIEELLWMLRGSTDSKELEAVNVNIWKGHTSREFLDSRGLTTYNEGDLGPGYGYQWRNAGGKYPSKTGGIDQIAQVVTALKEDPSSRRHVVCSWSPVDNGAMALVPCHAMFQFYIDRHGLSCMMTQRSADVFLGVGFNIASYAILTHLIAKMVDVNAHELVHVIGDAHIYKEHYDAASTQVSRKPFPFPKIRIKPGTAADIKDLDTLSATDFEVVGYECHPVIKAKMIV